MFIHDIIHYTYMHYITQYTYAYTDYTCLHNEKARKTPTLDMLWILHVQRSK